MVNLKKAIYNVLILAISCILPGCGYSTGSLLPTHLKTIYVDNFKNKIDIGQEVTEGLQYKLYRPGLENDVTTAIIQRFIFDGNLKIEKKDKADLLLTGELVEYRQDALRYDTNDNVEEYRVRVAVNLKLEEVSTGKVMWEDNGFVGESTYNMTGQFVVSEDTACAKAIEDLARRVVERTVEGW